MEYKSKKIKFDQTLIERTSLAKNSEESIRDKKASLIILVALLLLCDLLTVFYCAFVGVETLSLIFLGLMIVFDISYIATLSILNAKFKSASILTYAFIGISFSCSIACALGLRSVTSSSIAFLFPLIKLIELICISLTKKHISNPKKINKKVATVIFALAVCFTAAFSAVTSFVGLYGTNYSLIDNNRAITLTLKSNKGNEYYAVTAVRPGIASNCVIPESINGIAVTEIDSSVLATNGIKTLTLESKNKIAISNIKKLNSIKSYPKIIVDKSLIDSYKQDFYTSYLTDTSLSSSEKTTYLNCVKLFEPKLDSNEYYVSFLYDISALPTQISDIYVKTKFADSTKNSHVNIYDLIKNNQTLETLYTNRQNLEWCVTNSSALAMKEPSALEGSISNLGQVNQNTVINISFEEVFKVNISKGDYSYNPISWTDSTYATASLANIDLTTNRVGCYANWKLNYGTNSTDISSTQDITNALSSYEHPDKRTQPREITLFPEWYVNPINVTNFIATSDTSRINTFIYGDKITISADNVEHALTSNMTYSLLYKKDDSTSTIISTTAYEGAFVFNEQVIDKILKVSDSGTYTLIVRATDLDSSNLYAEHNFNLDVKVNPKPINGIWTVNEQENYTLTYNGLPASVNFTMTDTFIVSDDVSYSTSTDTIQNVGQYTPSLSLNGSDAENYKFSTPSITVIVNPVILTENYSKELVYNATNQQLSVAFFGVVNNETLDYKIYHSNSDANTSVMNAGDYSVTIDLLSTNYRLSNNNSTLSYNLNVKKAPISIIDWSNIDLTYTGYPQKPLATFTGLGSDGTIYPNVLGEKLNANASTYLATIENNLENYIIENASLTTTFTIKKATISSVNWSNTTLTYNGRPQIPSATISGLGDDGILSLTISGAQNNVGTNYLATVSNNLTNYEIHSSCLVSSFDINPMNINEVIWNNTTVTYTGLKQLPTAYFIGALSEHVNLQVNADRDTKDCGTYPVVAVNSNANYSITSTLLQNSIKIDPYILNSTSINWGLLSRTYTGDKQTLEPTIAGVNHEVISLAVTTASDAINVGPHLFTAQLQNTNYSFPSAAQLSNTLVITTYMLTSNNISWGTYIYDFDGNSHSLTPTIQGVKGETLYLNVAPANIVNAGTHSITASIANNNYSFEENSLLVHDLIINPKEISDIAWSNLSVVYNGLAQTPSAIAYGINENINITISLNKEAINADSYTATAVSTNSNYKLIGNKASQNFIITPLQIDSISWDTTKTIPVAFFIHNNTTYFLNVTTQHLSDNRYEATASTVIDNINFTISPTANLKQSYTVGGDN